ncbi:dimethylallyl tryptophan synthase GliD1 [Nemania sp. NC0429]|nr:dimethylallyl tryptophan synthase GliD1 [Nemania sp. NC0429]
MNSSVAKQPLVVWESVSKWLPSVSPSRDFWWRLTGPHLAALVSMAGYTTEQQYEALLFYYHWIVPYMGSAPGLDGKLQWKTIPLSDDGTPLEWSWKWNKAGGKPEIRFCIEGIGELTGTDMDPLNHQATRHFFHQLRPIEPSVDLSLVDHFATTLFDYDYSKYAQEAAAGAPYRTTMMMAPELSRSGYRFKTYFMPRRIQQPEPTIPLDMWEESLAKLDPVNEARAMVWDFLRNHPEGKRLKPFMIGVDNNAESSQSRIKLYAQTPITTFAAVRAMMTLGGLKDVPESRIEDLRDFIMSVLGLPADFADDAELPMPMSRSTESKEGFENLTILLRGSMCYFDLAVGAKVPEVKFYLLARRYASDDRSLARGVTSWMESRGRGEFCPNFLSALQSIAQHRSLDKGTGIQTYISFLISPSGEIDVTSYLCPEALHPARMATSNGHK